MSKAREQSLGRKLKRKNIITINNELMKRGEFYKKVNSGKYIACNGEGRPIAGAVPRDLKEVYAME